MLSASPSADFPLDAVRDVLGLARIIFAARRSAGAPAAELERVRRAGADLTRALTLALESRPGTVGMRAAWAAAEKGARGLGDVVQATESAEPWIAAACARVRR